MVADVTNAQLADVLEHIANLLEAQNSNNPFRVRAYLEGANTLRQHENLLQNLFMRNSWMN